MPDWLIDSEDGSFSFFLHAEGQGDLESVEFFASPGDDLGVIAAAEGELMSTAKAPAAEPGEATVTVINESGVPATLFAQEVTDHYLEPVHIRIANVPANSTTTVAIPTWVTDYLDASERPVRFFVQPRGGVDLDAHETWLEREENVEILIPETR